MLSDLDIPRILVELFANSGDPDQTTASDLGLHCLPITLLGVSRLQWVNIFSYFSAESICCGYSFDAPWWQKFSLRHGGKILIIKQIFQLKL